MTFLAKDWFRNQVTKYLKIIKELIYQGDPIAVVFIENTGQNYATDNLSVVPWGSNIAANSTPNFITAKTGNAFEMEMGGLLQLTGNLSMEQILPNFNENNVIFYWEKMDAGSTTYNKVGGNYCNNHMSGNSDNTQVSQSFPPLLIDVEVGSRLRMRHQRVSGTGGITRRDSGDSYIIFQLKRRVV